MRNKTQEEFEQDVAINNPEIQVLGNYINNATKIKVMCKKCGRIWDAVPTRITIKYQCPLCKKREEFNAYLEENSLIAIDDYQNNLTRVRVRCKKCNYCWDAVPKTLKKGGRCPKCYHNGKSLKWTNETFAAEMKKLSPNIVLQGNYHGYEDKIQCQCSICGYSFSQSPHRLLKGAGCPKCNGHQQWTPEEYEKKIEAVNPQIIVSGFNGLKKKVNCKCRSCGYEWTPQAYDIMTGHGCPKCAGYERLNFPKFKKEFEASNPTIEILDTDVKTTTTMIKCQCKRCGNIWITNISRLKQGNGCILCNHSSTSFMEQAILKSFRTRLGEKSVLSRNKTAIGKELDVYIPSMSIAFEPGGWPFHKHHVKRDEIKRQLCKERGIRLITIYDNYSEVEAPFQEDCYVYAKGLGAPVNREELESLIALLFEICNISPRLTEEEWVEVQKYAIEHSKHKDPKETVKEIYDNNPDVIIISRPTRVHERILCRCKKCGHEWLATPANLKRGSGCPKCAGTKKLTQKEFEQQLKETNPNIIALEQYKNITHHILFHCNDCGYEWKASPRQMIRQENQLCPVCRKKKNLTRVLVDRGVSLQGSDVNQINMFCHKNTDSRYTTEEFAWLISRVNPNVEIIGEYSKIGENISCRCRRCGHEWQPRAEHILNGHGCPKCN